MKIQKKFIKFFSILATFVFVMLLSSQNVNAAYYEKEKNLVTSYSIDRDANKFSLTIQYQNGVKNINAYICEITYLPQNDRTIGNCKSNAITTFNINVSYVNQGDDLKFYYADVYSPTNGKELNSYNDTYDSNGNIDNQYAILISADFCQTRNKDNTECLSWVSQYKYESFTIEAGLTGSGTLNSSIKKVLNVINTIVIPVLWVVLGILLIVRGIMLGMDIVKAADEPEVRKKKVGGIIWLAIGVGLGYLVTIVAKIVMTKMGYGGIY